MKVSNRETMMAFLAYVFFPIPMITKTKDAERSEFVRFHVNQSAVLFMANAAFSIVYLIVAVLLHHYNVSAWVSQALFSYTPKLDWLSWLLSFSWALPVIMWGIGVRNVYAEEMKPLPIIGKHKIIK